jgi:hypothetical protein
MFGLFSTAYAIIYFHRTHGLEQGLRGSCRDPRGANLLKDTARREVSRAFNEKMRARKEREQAQGDAHRAMKERTEGTPMESGSSGDEEEEGERTPPPQSSPRITPPPFRDVVSRQVGYTIGERQSKRFRIGTRSSNNSPRQLYLSLVTYDPTRRG